MEKVQAVPAMAGSAPYGALRQIARYGSLVFGAALMAGMAYDRHMGRRLWPSTPTRLYGVDENTTEAMVTFSGLGSLDGANQSKHARRLMDGNHAYWMYSSAGISITSLAAMLKHRAPQLKHAGLNGHSMGGPLGLEVFRRAGLRDLTLGMVALHCSPHDIGDVYNRSAAKLASWVGMVPAGPGTKYAFSFTRARLEGKDFGSSREQARRDAKSGCSTQLWLSHIKVLATLNPSKYVERYKWLIGPQTHFIYFRPDDPAMDTTVNTLQARDKYAAFADRLGVPFTDLPVPEAGHADVQRACAHFALHGREGV